MTSSAAKADIADHLNDSRHDFSYSVRKRDGLTFLYGHIPIHHMEQLATASPGDEWMDSVLAGALGATMVWGSREACQAERSRVKDELMAIRDQLGKEKQFEVAKVLRQLAESSAPGKSAAPKKRGASTKGVRNAKGAGSAKK